MIVSSVMEWIWNIESIWDEHGDKYGIMQDRYEVNMVNKMTWMCYINLDGHEINMQQIWDKYVMYMLGNMVYIR